MIILPTMKLDLDNGHEELEIDVEFDYQPYEDSTLEYPGCSESVEIEGAYLSDGTEICLLEGVSDRLAEILLDEIHDLNNDYDGDY